MSRAGAQEAMPQAFDPGELFVLHLSDETLIGREQDFSQALDDVWEEWSQMREVDLAETLLYLLPRSVRFVAEFQAEELVRAFPRFPLESHPGIRDRLRASS